MFSLAFPATALFEAITFNEVSAAKKERKKPPKARRTKTMSKKVATEFIKAQDALAEDRSDTSLKILNNLLTQPELRGFEKATIVRLKGYVYAEKEEYQKFFNAALKKYGVSSPDDLKDEKKKDFYNYIDANWKGDNEND